MRNGKPRAYTPKKTKDYEFELRAAAYRARFERSMTKPLDVPVSMIVKAFIPIPRSWSKKRREAAHYASARPDIDNYAKSVLDALNGIVYRDDSQVVDLFVRKLYDDNPRLEITVQEMPPLGAVR